MIQERISTPFGYGRLEALNRNDYVRSNLNGEVPVFVAGTEVLPVGYNAVTGASGAQASQGQFLVRADVAPGVTRQRLYTETSDRPFRMRPNPHIAF